MDKNQRSKTTLMQLDQFNSLDGGTVAAQQVFESFFECCASKAWVSAIVAGRPYDSIEALRSEASKIWFALSEKDWLDAFDGHPKIGDPASLKAKYQNTQSMATHEQSGVQGASQQVLDELVEFNQAYFDKFGFIFIVCATGKSAVDMLELVKMRLQNERNAELAIAAQEQAKITIIRLNKLFESAT